MSISHLLGEKLSFAKARTHHQISATVYRPDKYKNADQVRRAHMKSLLLAATAVFLAATATLSPAPAAAPFAANSAGITTGTPHYEWQYHYGKKARFEGHWALVQ